MGLALETKRPFGEENWDWHYRVDIEDAAFDFYVTHGHLRGFLHEFPSVEYPFKNNGETTTPAERRAFMKCAKTDYQRITANTSYLVSKSTIGSFLLNAASAGLDISPTGNAWQKFDTTHEDFLRSCADYLSADVAKNFQYMLAHIRYSTSITSAHKNLMTALQNMSDVSGRPLELYQALGLTKQDVDTQILEAVFIANKRMTPALKQAMRMMDIHPQRVRDVFNNQTEIAKRRIDEQLTLSRLPFERPVLAIKREPDMHVTASGIVGLYQRLMRRGRVLRHA